MGIVVIGASFIDVKGFPNDIYLPTGRNVGRVEYVHGGVARNVVEDIAALTASVASLAKSVEQMAKAQEKQGERLIALEQKPAQRWDSLVDKAVWALGAALIAFLLTKLGLS